MEYILPGYSLNMPPFCTWEDAFSEEELDYIQQHAAIAELPGEVGRNNKNGASVNLEVRRVKVSFKHNDPEHNWVYERLGDVISSLNSDYYQFDLTGFAEPVQLGNYSSKDQGTYNWHVDFGKGLARKLSLVMQLSSPDSYLGGDLEIQTGNKPVAVARKRGLIAVFPSWVLHRVTPVTEGSRQSLVTWINGPRFK